jgi:hypothetical protein
VIRTGVPKGTNRASRVMAEFRIRMHPWLTA